VSFELFSLSFELKTLQKSLQPFDLKGEIEQGGL
jgi:hypothetical protein